MVHPACFLTQLQDTTSSGSALPTEDLACPHQSIKKVPPQTCIQTSLMKAFSLSRFLSQVTLVCVQLIEKAIRTGLLRVGSVELSSQLSWWVKGKHRNTPVFPHISLPTWSHAPSELQETEETQKDTHVYSFLMLETSREEDWEMICGFTHKQVCDLRLLNP